jgi:hypothetical protein
MLNKPYLLFSLSFFMVFMAHVAEAMPTQNEKNVNININPDSAQMVSLHHSDARLKALRVQANQQAAKQANAQNESFISLAPDPNDPNYWKNKNSDQVQSDKQVQSSHNNFLSEQQLQRQTTALQQILSSLKSNREKGSKFSVVAFKMLKGKAMSGKTGKGSLKAALALPGTVWYATMDNGADSYVPGPVIAEIQEGPFSGAKTIGKFEVAPDGKHLILTFNVMSFSGRSYPISAVAMDPATKISGVTGEIDHHIFTRFIIPGAASFLEEVTQALMNQNQSIVTNPSGIVVSGPKLSSTQLALMGAGGATKSIASATRPEGVLRLPEVKVQPGQGIGFLVLKPIL